MARKSKVTPDQRVALRRARQKKQEKYWENRAQSRVLATDRQVDAIRKDSDRAYRDAIPAEKRATTCIDCGVCLPKCPQQIRIPNQMSRLVELTRKRRR